MPLEERDVVRLRDMVIWSRKAIAMRGNRSYDEAMADEEKMLALVRCIEVIGEAGHDVSAETKAALSTIPWPAMYGMRNRLIHDYGNTNYRVVFDVVADNLPVLASAIARFLAEQGHPL
jgi:uncharacterized protein with HEPN domain